MLQVQVRLFASLRRLHPEAAAGSPLMMETAEGATVADILLKLGISGLQLTVFVNGLFQPLSQVLHAGDQVDVFPPLAGG